MSRVKRDCLRVSIIGVTCILVLGCGGGGSSSSTSTNMPINLPSLGQPLPSGVISYEEFSTNVSRIHLAENEFSGQSVIFQKVESQLTQPSISLYASDYDFVNGWSSEQRFKDSLTASEVKVTKDSLGDVHASWFTPGIGIFARSRVNNFWGSETLLTASGSCLDLDSQVSGVGTKAVWCEAGNLIGAGEQDSSGWIFRGVLEDSSGESIKGMEPSFELLDNNNYLTAWLTTESQNNLVENVLYVGINSSVSVNLSQTPLARLDASTFSINEVFSNGDDSHIVVWTDNSNLSNELNVSVFDGAWSTPAILSSVIDGYSNFEAYFLADGSIYLVAHRFNRSLAIYHYNGLTWDTVDELENVQSFHATQFDNELIFVYSRNLETAGIRLHDEKALGTIFKLDQPVNDIGVSITDNDKLLLIWRANSKAVYAVLKI